jgi:hypothetical protein
VCHCGLLCKPTTLLLPYLLKIQRHYSSSVNWPRNTHTMPPLVLRQPCILPCRLRGWLVYQPSNLRRNVCFEC